MIIIVKRQFIRRYELARVTTMAPYNVRCSYSAKELLKMKLRLSSFVDNYRDRQIKNEIKI